MRRIQCFVWSFFIAGCCCSPLTFQPCATRWLRFTCFSPPRQCAIFITVCRQANGGFLNDETKTLSYWRVWSTGSKQETRYQSDSGLIMATKTGALRGRPRQKSYVSEVTNCVQECPSIWRRVYKLKTCVGYSHAHPALCLLTSLRRPRSLLILFCTV